MDSEIKKVIDDIFYEIDSKLMIFETDFKFKRLMNGDNKPNCNGNNADDK